MTYYVIYYESYCLTGECFFVAAFPAKKQAEAYLKLTKVSKPERYFIVEQDCEKPIDFETK